LVVCHGGVIGAVLSGALGLRKARVWRTARAANTSITELSYTREGALLHVFNDTLHLLPLGGFPAHGELKGSVALLCEVPAELCSLAEMRASTHSFGEFAARYERDALREIGEDLPARLSELARRHPEQRVALDARAEQIHAWAETVMIGDVAGAGRLVAPRAGSVCHAGSQGEQTLLLDYGLRW
jgi:hypothetical protein